ncbi:MAG: hypothetical protein ACAH80_04765 [Alphaproteobacteria bacterium]
MSGLIFTLLGFGIFGLLCFIAYHAGKADQIARQYERDDDAERRALAARDRLLSDPAYAERVRKRFTR